MLTKTVYIFIYLSTTLLCGLLSLGFARGSGPGPRAAGAHVPRTIPYTS